MRLGVFERGPVTNRAVRSLGVVFDAPGFDELSGMGELKS
jgi:hypothetical protein